MKCIFIPEIRITIGENLDLRIENVSFLPAVEGYTSGAPEDCYEPEPAEINWKDNDAYLVYKDKHEFDCPAGLPYEYYDMLIDAIEEMEEL